jgi:large subunit ribosomal protein L28
MSRKCELTGKGVLSGNNVSHAKNRTKRKFLPNLNNISLSSDMLGRSFQLKISTSALRTVNKVGGLDPFLVKAKPEYLSENALKIKRDIEKFQLEQGSS